MTCEVKEKGRVGTINPIFTCQPAGAQFVSIGIKDCIGIVHGGQGCVMFVRLIFSQHYKESFELASSSLHEDGAVFGACGRVEEAVDVLLSRYPDVKVVPIITTCSTEIIGDDVDGVIKKLNEGLLKEKFPDREVHLIAMHTPSFVGSMISGYDVAVRDVVRHFAKREAPNDKINLLTGWVNPGDVKELKHLLGEMDIEANVLFEIESFDSPILPDGSAVSHGNTTIEDLIDTGNARATFALNRYEGTKAAEYLQKKFEIPAIIGPTPIGIRNTDIFLQNLKKATGKPIPQSLAHERGVAIDALADLTHMFLAEKRVAIYGAPDLVIGLAEFCLDLEMKPVLLLLGDDNSKYVDDPRIKALQENVDYGMEIVTNADFWELENRIKNEGLELDLILGHSKGRFISIDYNIPMLRVGFPTYDRAGLFRYPTVGYGGAIWLAEQMANTLFADMEHKKNKEWVLNVW
ncbi:Fe-only nitrogenase, beta subunit [Azotobacter vinelandii CA]|uniref:Nitrogenase iron-iron protein beta chain n=5 Tax=Azotobacter group TaxID=351 RepID=ANFK_AZOVI|nr:Fe-only nitrogenase subunit beta [Azotobacter vinelandii]P16267.3 RecName: Full=Nitrogenase iron-iron protein beta chain; AltName: Full=Dinitrogenase 3 subunit beta; AltName: Full=Nitrogenase component I [Azotobacter vinelandii]AAA82511.1 nitrogenase 3 subunit K [Azotobacter vinelandii]ACO80997.1 Fe-only nitrogenase, beta subunit [Azotobacter vinelandii DJ]AGK13259.1 Fe-only nitrogenase, beta subunit [Azotobacter vinelandii CA]AGK17548.1 Fe-only nitrogenase, beta subunit [Azotobacter vinela